MKKEISKRHICQECGRVDTFAFEYFDPESRQWLTLCGEKCSSVVKKRWEKVCESCKQFSKFEIRKNPEEGHQGTCSNCRYF